MLYKLVGRGGCAHFFFLHFYFYYRNTATKRCKKACAACYIVFFLRGHFTAHYGINSQIQETQNRVQNVTPSTHERVVVKAAVSIKDLLVNNL